MCVCAYVCIMTFLTTVFFFFFLIQIFERRSLAKMKTGLFFVRPKKFVCVCVWMSVCSKNVIVALWLRIIYLERCLRCRMFVCVCLASCVHFEHMSKICLWMIPVWLFLLSVSPSYYPRLPFPCTACCLHSMKLRSSCWMIFIAWNTPKIDVLYFWSTKRSPSKATTSTKNRRNLLLSISMCSHIPWGTATRTATFETFDGLFHFN